MDHYKEGIVNVIKNYRKDFSNAFVYSIEISVPVSAAKGDYSRLLQLGRILLNSNKKSNGKTNRQFFKDSFYTGVYKITIKDAPTDPSITYTFICFSLIEASTEILRSEINARVMNVFDDTIVTVTSIGKILKDANFDTVFNSLEKHSSINIYSDNIKKRGIEFLQFVLDILFSSVQSFGLLHNWGFICYTNDTSLSQALKS